MKSCVIALVPLLAFTVSARGRFNDPDSHLDAHPPVPDIVSRGRKPDVPGCGSCHLPNGFGRPENASLAGLPAVYIAQQMADYRRGVRNSAEPSLGAPAAMAAIGKAADEAEVHAASEYFASIAFKSWTRVVEVATVPKTRVSDSVFVQIGGGSSEPIGSRVVEVPADRTRAELRDAASGYVAYVPVGSIKRGEALVTTGAGGRTVRCALCHADDLKGLGSAPGLAGRSPSYAGRHGISRAAAAGRWSRPDLPRSICTAVSMTVFTRRSEFPGTSPEVQLRRAPDSHLFHRACSRLDPHRLQRRFDVSFG